jgi:hypothetical protein
MGFGDVLHESAHVLDWRRCTAEKIRANKDRYQHSKCVSILFKLQSEKVFMMLLQPYVTSVATLILLTIISQVMR